MNIGVVGSRTFNLYDVLEEALDRYIKDQGLSHKDVTIISGGAKGADSLGRRYAETRKTGYKEHLPDYTKYGKSAPFVRNKLIVKDSEVIIAFWDGESRGTAHTLTLAQQSNIPTIIITF